MTDVVKRGGPPHRTTLVNFAANSRSAINQATAFLSTGRYADIDNHALESLTT